LPLAIARSKFNGHKRDRSSNLHKIEIRFGEPINAAEVLSEVSDQEAAYNKLTDRLKNSIQQMPEEMRSDREKDALSLYDKLENVVLPLFYQNRDRYIDVMLHCIALNGSFFNSHRMLQQYVIAAVCDQCLPISEKKKAVLELVS
jgi:hypothetical protein